MNPRVSVIMPVYNGEKYLRQAVESVLRQTFTDFELIIINDGSTDNSSHSIRSFTDPRVVVIENKQNVGLSTVRNRGLEIARGEFIAFLDCDDIAYPERLELQVAFLLANPDVGLVGSFVRLIDENGKPGVSWRDYIPSEQFPIRIMFGNTFTTSSVLLRKTALPQERFREGFAPAEDYDLWVRILKQWKGWNIPKILTDYRTHTAGTSVTKKALQQTVIERIIRLELKEIGIEPSPEEFSVHRKNYGFAGTSEETKKFLEARSLWLLTLIARNKKIGRYPDKLFERVMADRWLESCDANARLGLKLWNIFRDSPLAKMPNRGNSWKKLLRFGIKCVLSKDTL